MAATTTTYERQTHHNTNPPHYRYDHAGNRLPAFYPHHLSEGPSTGKLLALMALLPVGGILLGLAGITLAGTMIGLAIATPLFIIFSPVLVPAVLILALSVAGFLTAGTFGLTGLSSLSYFVNMLRQTLGSVPEQIDYAREKMEDIGVYTGQKTKEMGQTIQHKAHEMGNQGQGLGQGGQGQGIYVQAGVKDGGKNTDKKGDRT